MLNNGMSCKLLSARSFLFWDRVSSNGVHEDCRGSEAELAPETLGQNSGLEAQNLLLAYQVSGPARFLSVVYRCGVDEVEPFF